MKWIKDNHRLGDTRVMLRFLIFPKTLERVLGDGFVWETRWLEWAEILEEYETPMHESPCWREVRWV